MEERITIYYNTGIHPSHDEYYAERYYDPLFLDRVDDSKPFPIVKKDFRKYWKKLFLRPYEIPVSTAILTGTKEGTMPRDKYREIARKKILNELYAVFNTDNPLYEPRKQQMLKDVGVRHTSMSVMDIIQIGRVYYIVTGFGFAKVKFV